MQSIVGGGRGTIFYVVLTDDGFGIDISVSVDVQDGLIMFSVASSSFTLPDGQIRRIRPKEGVGDKGITQNKAKGKVL